MYLTPGYLLFPFMFLPIFDVDVDKKYVERRASQYKTSVITNQDGEFEMVIAPGNLLVGEDENVNLVLVNQDVENSGVYAQWTVSYKSTETDIDLGNISLCNFSTLQSAESSTAETLTWANPSGTFEKVSFKFLHATNNSLIWVGSPAAKTDTSLAVTKKVFQNNEIRVAPEVLYSVDDSNSKKKIRKSCVGASKTFTAAQPASSIATGSRGQVENMKPSVSTLANGRFDDGVIFSAFEPTTVTVDLGAAKSFSYISLHNLLVKEIVSNTLTVSGSNDKSTWTTLGQGTLSRFMEFTFSPAASARYLRFTAGAQIYNLQEVGVFE